MFTPFVDLPVNVERVDRLQGSAEVLRLDAAAHPRYAELLDRQVELDEAAAREEAERMVREQKERLAAAIRRPPPIDEAIEAKIESGDDRDDDLLQVYADMLQERGEPLGRQIALAQALARGAGEVAQLSAELDRAQRETLAAEGLSSPALGVSWRNGLIEGARIAVNWPGRWVDEVDPTEVLAGLLSARAARFMRQLTFGLLDEEGDLSGALGELLTVAGPLPALRSLSYGDFECPDECEMSWTVLDDPPPYACLAELRELTIQGGQLELGEIHLPWLQRFELRSGSLTGDNLTAVAEARWPELTDLVLWLGDPAYGAEATIDDLEPLLAARGLPRLTRLGLCNTVLSDEICQELPHSPVASQLTELDLSLGTLSDAGARALAAEAGRLPKLRSLRVDESFLTPDGIGALRQAGWELSVGQQKAPEEADERYVSVGE